MDLKGPEIVLSAADDVVCCERNMEKRDRGVFVDIQYKLIEKKHTRG